MVAAAEIMGRHQRGALQVSGGRDSLAVFYLLEQMGMISEFMTVYWVNTGSMDPSGVDAIKRVKERAPRFVEIPTNARSTWQMFGLPSDIVPVANTPDGLMVEDGQRIMIQPTLSCCARNIMEPMHRRVLEDGHTLIVRGQRNAERYKAPTRSGYTEGGIELWFPIEDWSDGDVDSFLTDNGVELPLPYREGLGTMPDCLQCPGWLSERRAGYLKEHYPDAYREYRAGLTLISEAVRPSIDLINLETQ